MALNGGVHDAFDLPIRLAAVPRDGTDVLDAPGAPPPTATVNDVF